jgi:hypothetical protein
MRFPRQNLMNDVFFMNYRHYFLHLSLARLKVYWDVCEISKTPNAAYRLSEVE